MTPIKTICMDCKEVVEEGPLSKDGLVSDGLCSRCGNRRRREEGLPPIRIRLGDRVQYATSSEDDHPVSPGTIVYGVVTGRSAGTVNVHWDKLGITEYGIPEETLEKVGRR